MRKTLVVCGVLLAEVASAGERRQNPWPPAVAEPVPGAYTAPPTTPGSLYVAGGSMVDYARDLRASAVGDLVTILVADRATATTRGTVDSSRSAAASGGVNALFGTLPQSIAPRAAGLLNLNGQQNLKGQGQTSRENELTTSLSGRVVAVLPNGVLQVQAEKRIRVNNEDQIVYVTGLVRPYDISVANTLASDRLADLQVWISGKGVVGDAVRRPNILYRILLGILPF